MNHHYMLPLKQQACRGREVVFYDQVGAGESAQPPDPRRSAPWLFEIDYYVEELSELITALGWREFHFLGNSWGTIVGQAYALAQDPRLRAVVLSGPLSDAQLYVRSQWDEEEGNLGSLPPFVQATLRRLQDLEAFTSPLYAAEDSVLTSFFTVRTTPLPDCVKKGVNLSNTSREIYVGMQGASEFVIGGVLATFNFTPRLHEIRNPVLLTHGRYDTMRPPVVDVMYRTLPLAWRALLPHSGHMSMIDDPRLMNDIVGSFLQHEERGTLAQFAVPGAASEEPVQCSPLGPSAVLAEAPSASPPWLPAVVSAVASAGVGAAVASAVMLRHIVPRLQGRQVFSAPPLLS
ncbi:unnamed protein product [Polarella glacialis]|uniref:AB hydrolase-1 domain-containing protein n=1 Tax=Polarella glacialis TaxID=89957 RepID=A0A813F315_POLGL|nr:unnamed protein product [Polarella glacialis]